MRSGRNIKSPAGPTGGGDPPGSAKFVGRAQLSLSLTEN